MAFRRFSSGRHHAVFLALLLPACSSGSSPQLPHFNDITNAPAAIQTAAKAVVRIRTAGQVATGSFISPSGLLLTNNHVLGDSVCPIEGCYFEVTRLRQRGQTRQQATTVFGVPTAVDVGLDSAVVQVYDGPGGAALVTPADGLLGMHVTIVGHPAGYLKKWTDGTVMDTSGKWFKVAAYTLPGDSGSPALDDQGQIVGLMHRGPTSEDLISDVGVNLYSIGTASSDLSLALANPLPGVMVSVKADTTADAFTANNSVYLNARVATVSVGGVRTSALTLLANACDAALAQTVFASPGALSTVMQPCYDSHNWIECRSDASSKPYGTLCPDGADIPKWVSRTQGVNQASVLMNGALDYSSVSFGVAALQPTMTAGTVVGGQSLQQAVADANPPLDITLAYYLAAFNIDSYQAASIHDYIVNYLQVPHYEFSAKYVAWAATWLAGNGHMSKTALVPFLKNLLDDSKVSVGDQLAIEDYLYGMDAL